MLMPGTDYLIQSIPSVIFIFIVTAFLGMYITIIAFSTVLNKSAVNSLVAIAKRNDMGGYHFLTSNYYS